MTAQERETSSAPTDSASTPTALADDWGRAIPTEIAATHPAPEAKGRRGTTSGVRAPAHPRHVTAPPRSRSQFLRRSDSADDYTGALAQQQAAHDAILRATDTTTPKAPAAPKATNPTTAPAPRRWERLSERVGGIALVALWLYLLFLPLLDQAVGVTTTWIVYLAFVAVGAARLRFARTRGAWIAGLAVLPWLAWALTWPRWSAWAPDSRAVQAEQMWLLACGLLTLAAIAIGAGSRRGVELHRVAWLTLGAVVVPIGLWEVTTQQHLGPGPWLPPPWSAAATYPNPNNFAAVLLVVYGLALGRLTERLTRVDRLVTAALAVASLAVMVATLSRMAVAAALLVTVGAAVLECRRRGLLRRPSPAAGDRPAWLAPVGITAAVAALVASLTWPVVARGNPLAQFLFPGDASTARADDLRASLIRQGLDLWSTDPWRGIGAARFEVLLQERGFERVMPMHNGFLEILTEYGLVVAWPLALWILALGYCLLAPAGPGRAIVMGRPRGLDRAGTRYALGVWLAAFGVAGLVTSSPLTWQLWYLMAAGATVAAWPLRART